MPAANTKQPKQPKAPPAPGMAARLAFRLPEEVAQSWRDQAKASGSNLSDWVRSKVDAAQVTGIASPNSTPKRRSYTPIDPDLLRQVAMIGNNLNQIARAVNAKDAGITSVQIIANLSAIRQDLNDFMASKVVKNAD